jgi:hypothetical protein
MDEKGRVWFTAKLRPDENPAFCKQGSDHPSAKLAPLQTSGRQLSYEDLVAGPVGNAMASAPRQRTVNRVGSGAAAERGTTQGAMSYGPSVELRLLPAKRCRQPTPQGRRRLPPPGLIEIAECRRLKRCGCAQRSLIGQAHTAPLTRLAAAGLAIRLLAQVGGCASAIARKAAPDTRSVARRQEPRPTTP